MSGHNRWSKIKNVKGAVDAKKGKLFSKINKELAVAARTGGGNPDTNARLRQAILAARAASMPKDNIERAIKRGTGEVADAAAIEEVTYEGYGPGGVAILVETTSDNKNRTISDLRNLFKSSGGNMAESGSVAWMFTHHGQLLFDAARYPEDTVMEVALEAGAQDIQSHEDTVEVLTAPADVYKVREAFEKVGMVPTHVGFSFVPKTSVPVDKSGAEKLLHLLDNIEDHDDVQRVHSNADIDEKILNELAAAKSA